MARWISKGKCSFCGREISQGQMGRHLLACKQRPDDPPRKRARILHLAVEGSYAPMFWMHLEMPADTTLTQLDSFLRHTWLECCGHLSAYEIGDDRYVSYTDPEWIKIGSWGKPDKSMSRVKLGKVVAAGDTFHYEYDFGTTTPLTLKVVAEREGAVPGDQIAVLARNDPPDFRCQECGAPATEVCSECIWIGEGWLCDECAEDDECGEEMLLPVVNSPRVGMCAYTG